MYKHSVPISISTLNDNIIDKLIDQLREGEFQRVLITVNGHLAREDSEIKLQYDKYAKYLKIFRDAGFEVGIWVNGFGHGADFFSGNTSEREKGYQLMVGADGRRVAESYCPLGKKFRDDYMSSIRIVAELHPDLIMIDDDYRLNFRQYTMGCACPLHMKTFNSRIGESIKRKDLAKLVLADKPNLYRREWFKLMGDTLRDFAKDARKAVDEIDENIRLGFCSCYDTWDYSGTDGIELTKIFAGKTAPFLRTISPPYHYKHASLAVEQTRMQAAWCRGLEIELFSEGDVYPRKRADIPAKPLEIFDSALTCCKETDGILKYVYCYDGPIDYETKYINNHIETKPLRKQLDAAFCDKSPVGVYIYEAPHKVEDWDLEGFPSDKRGKGMQNSFFSRAARLASSNGICTSYTDGRVPFVFGENARHISLDKLQLGAVLDVTAAKILASRGIDTGIIDSHADIFTSETFVCNGKTHSVGPILHKMSLRPNADPQSYFNDGSVGSYIYENTDGKIFFVLAYDAYESFGDSDEAYSDYLSSYSRQKSLIDAIERIGRQPLPAKCLGHPFLYVIASKDATADSMSVAIFNPFADDVCAPEIILGDSYDEIRFINCHGVLTEGSKVTLERIEPYGTAAFEVRKTC